MNIFRFVAIIILLLVACHSFAGAQTVDCPAGFVCISQQAANVAASNARELEATKAKVTVLEDGLKAKDVSIAELQELNRKNVADLTERIHKTEIELATKTGQLIGCEAQNVEQRAIIQAFLPMLRKKKIGLNIF